MPLVTPSASPSIQLAELHKQHAYRTRLTLDSPQGVHVTIGQQHYLSFCSNDYLGLANDPRVCDATVNAIRHYGVGSGASQLISGYTSLHSQLEQQLADFFNYPRCVLFSSGYMANLGVISSFATQKSLIVEDKLNHASLIDAAKYAGSKLKRYRHRNVEHAKKIIAREKNSQGLLVTDGVFSMEGSIAPLDELIELKQHSQYKLVIDDAHGIGVLGKHGRGSIEHENINSSEIDILIGTFGKSFGVSGAFVLSSEENIEYLIQTARTLIYTTAPPAALAAGALQSLDIIINEPERRKRLHDNIEYFRRCVKQTHLDMLDSVTAIQSLILNDNNKALSFSQALKSHGLLALAIRPPTVPKNTSRLRITLSSEHTHEHIDKLISTLLDIEKLHPK